jgi:hypothetical protein
VPKLWVKGNDKPEGKFLVVRRDGTVVEWPHFVIGARDPAAYGTLRAYAQAAEILGWDPEYVQSVRDLADDFENYLREHGAGDPPAGPHRRRRPVGGRGHAAAGLPRVHRCQPRSSRRSKTMPTHITKRGTNTLSHQTGEVAGRPAAGGDRAADGGAGPGPRGAGLVPGLGHRRAGGGRCGRGR